MNKDTQKQLALEIAQHAAKNIIADIDADKIPIEWDGIELHWLLSLRTDIVYESLLKRYRAFKNTLIVNGL